MRISTQPLHLSYLSFATAASINNSSLLCDAFLTRTCGKRSRPPVPDGAAHAIADMALRLVHRSCMSPLPLFCTLIIVFLMSLTPQFVSLFFRYSVYQYVCLPLSSSLSRFVHGRSSGLPLACCSRAVCVCVYVIARSGASACLQMVLLLLVSSSAVSRRACASTTIWTPMRTNAARFVSPWISRG